MYCYSSVLLTICTIKIYLWIRNCNDWWWQKRIIFSISMFQILFLFHGCLLYSKLCFQLAHDILLLTTSKRQRVWHETSKFTNQNKNYFKIGTWPHETVSPLHCFVYCMLRKKHCFMTTMRQLYQQAQKATNTLNTNVPYHLRQPFHHCPQGVGNCGCLLHTDSPR